MDRITERIVSDRIPSPSLYVDLDAADRNIRATSGALAGTGIKLRPHFKAHKCTQLMHRQLDLGGHSGVTCATAQEAVVLARAGFADILVANEIVERLDLDLIAAAARLAALTVVVDHPIQVARISSTASSSGVRIGVLIDVDPGLGRTGVAFDSPEVVELARAIARCDSLVFRGIQAYEGHVVLQRDPEVRRVMSWQVARLIEAAISNLQRAGFDCELISGGGTGTIQPAISAGVLTEIQAGSYVLMDTTYADIGLELEQAVFGVATVISRRSASSAAINAGTKSMNTDKGMPRVLTAGARLVGMGDEHGRLALDRTANLDVGDRVLLVPSHLDPTVNLHDVLLVESHGDLAVWRIDGRRMYMEEEV